LIDSPTQEVGDNCWVHIPLATVLSWGLPDNDLSSLLTNRPIVLPATAAGRDVGAMFESWLVDLAGGETEQFALLEVQALVGRLLHHNMRFLREHRNQASSDHPKGEVMHHVAQMAQYAVTHFRAPITPSDVARETHLNPNYAMTVFRERVGTTLGSYLTRCRVAEAQRLLITTSMTAAEIAHASGFGSQSSFYEHFTRACGSSPSGYRRNLRLH